MWVRKRGIESSSQRAMTSLSLIEPPGWITALTPAWKATSMESEKGKKASEAKTEPFRAGESLTLSTAKRTASTREVKPVPMSLSYRPWGFF